MSQNDTILKHLRKHRKITPLEALRRYGCMRLGGRVHDLRAQGHDIRTRMIKQNGKRYAQYTLEAS